MSTDLLILWPRAGVAGNHEAESETVGVFSGLPIGTGRTQRIAIECKLLQRGAERTLRDGLAQTRAYMDRCAADEGHLVIFDRDEGRSRDEKLYRREEREGAERGVAVVLTSHAQ